MKILVVNDDGIQSKNLKILSIIFLEKTRKEEDKMNYNKISIFNQLIQGLDKSTRATLSYMF